MNNYLFFRTDRIGDFLVSAILIKSIKRNNQNSYIIVISSESKIFNKGSYFKPEFYGGISENESKKLLKEFFLRKR